MGFIDRNVGRIEVIITASISVVWIQTTGYIKLVKGGETLDSFLPESGKDATIQEFYDYIEKIKANLI